MTGRTYATLLLLTGMLLNTLPAQAASGRGTGDTFSMNINISGTVIATGSCTFVKSDTVDIPFGEVKYSSVTGSKTLEGSYKQTLPSQMNCSGDTDGKAQMKLDTTVGTVVSDSGTDLLPVMFSGTQSHSLGIRLLAGGAAQSVGEWFDVDMTAPPVLEAELVQTGDGSDFTNGADFTASATLTMAFN